MQQSQPLILEFAVPSGLYVYSIKDDEKESGCAYLLKVNCIPEVKHVIFEFP